MSLRRFISDRIWAACANFRVSPDVMSSVIYTCSSSDMNDSSPPSNSVSILSDNADDLDLGPCCSCCCVCESGALVTNVWMVEFVPDSYSSSRRFVLSIWVGVTEYFIRSSAPLISESDVPACTSSSNFLTDLINCVSAKAWGDISARHLGHK